jgi:hypothetical protein
MRDELVAGARSADIEYRIIHPDGTMRYVHHIAQTTRSADGKFGCELAAVAPLGQQFASDTDDTGLARFDVLTQIVIVLRSIGFGQQDVDLQSDHVFFVVPEHALAGMIEQLDPPFVIEKHDRIGSRIEHGLELAFQTLGSLLLRLGDSK